jgi:high mobility group protein B1
LCVLVIDAIDFDGRLAVNKKGAPATKGGRKPAKGKEPKDPNKPKRPASAFFIFM